jgi:multiple sugar transport system permease protein
MITLCRRHQLLVVGALVWTSQLASANREQVDVWHVYTDRVAREVIEESKRQFEALHPQWSVRLLSMPWNSQQKLLTAVVGGVPPDVAMIDRPRLAQWAAKGALTPLDEFIQRDQFDGNRFFETAWKETLWEDNRYAIPINTDARVLYYNRRLFREAGLDPDRPPVTWDELIAYSDRLTVRAENGRLERVGFAPLFGNMGFGTAVLYTYAWQLGGEVMNEDRNKVLVATQPWIQAMDYTRAWRDRYGFRDLASFATGLGGYTSDPFITGRISMIEHGSWYLSMLRRFGGDIDFGVAPIPIPENGTPAFLSAGWSMAIPRGSKNPEGAWQFIQFFTNTESQKLLAEKLEAIPANRDATNIPLFTDDPSWQVILRQMPYARHHPNSPHSVRVFNAVLAAVERVVVENVDSRAALEEVASSIQRDMNLDLQESQAPPLNWTRTNTSIILFIALGLAAYGAVILSRLRNLGLERSQAISGILMASPWILGLIVFSVGPILASVAYSFSRYTILQPATYVGFANYERLLTHDPLFWTSISNTMYFALLGVPISVAFALGLALLLNQQVRGCDAFRTIFFIPSIVSGVAVSILWLWLLNPETGLINSTLRLLGIPGPLWLQSTEWSKPAIILMGLWGVGGSMIIFLAGLQSIPRHLYEVALLDGASPSAQFRHITLPFITPTIFFNLVVGFIGAFQVFTPAFVMTGGGPADSTLFYALYLFRHGFEYFNMGYASALAWILFLVTVVVSAVQFLISRYWVYYGDER